MIRNILDMLHLHKAYGVGETIEIAKGKYAIPRTYKEVLNHIIRDIRYGKK
jgi:hypothetical protein